MNYKNLVSFISLASMMVIGLATVGISDEILRSESYTTMEALPVLNQTQASIPVNQQVLIKDDPDNGTEKVIRDSSNRIVEIRNADNSVEKTLLYNNAKLSEVRDSKDRVLYKVDEDEKTVKHFNYDEFGNMTVDNVSIETFNSEFNKENVPDNSKGDPIEAFRQGFSRGMNAPDAIKNIGAGFSFVIEKLSEVVKHLLSSQA